MAQKKFGQKTSFSEAFSETPQSQKILMGVIIILGIGLIWYFSYYQNLLSHSSKLRAEVANLSDFEKRLPLEMKKYALISKKLDSYRQMLPEKQEIPQLLVSIHNAIAKVGVTMNKFNPELAQSQNQNATYMTTPIQISISGTYNQIGNTFEKLNSLSRLVKVKDFTISPSNTQSGILSADFKAETYSLKQSNTQNQTRSKSE